MTGLARFRNDVEAPFLVAGLRVERRDVAADSVFTAGGSENDFVFHDERHQGERVIDRSTRGRRLDFVVPHFAAGFSVDGDQVRIDRCEIETVALNRDTFTVASAARSCFAGTVRVGPEDSSGRRVECYDFVVGHGRLHDVHDPVDDDRRGFELGDAIHRADLQDPLEFEVLHVIRCDLGEQAVTLIEKAAAVRQPVLRLLVRIENSLEGNLLAVDGACNQ